MKVWNYVFVMVGVIVLLQLGGISTAADSIFNLIGLNFNSDNTINATTVSASGFYDTLFGNTSTGDSSNGILIAIAAALGSIAIGAFTRTKPENLILLPLITGTLVLFIQTINGIMNLVIANGNTWIAAIMVLLLIPFSIGFIVALAEFFRGSD